MQTARLPSTFRIQLLVLSLLSLTPAVAQLSTPSYPPGFEDTVYYTDTLPLSALAFDPQGRLYVSNLYGGITIVEDTNGDRVPDVTTQFFNGSTITGAVTGILWFQNKLYVSYAGTIMTLEDTDGDDVADVQTILQSGLPVSLHQNNALFTDGQWIYFGIGSLTDHDVDPQPAGVLARIPPDGSSLQIFATGLRNAFDGVWHGASSSLLVGDNGPNFVASQPHPEDEVNRVIQGQDYGHPQNWGLPPAGSTSVGPFVRLPAHTAPTGMAVNPNTALSGYANEVLIAGFSGGLGRMPVVSGTASGNPISWLIPFAGGFNKPTDLLFSPLSGELYVAEYQTKQVRIVHQTHPVVLTAQNTPSIASIFELRVAAHDSPSATYLIAASDAQTNPTVIGPGVSIDLDLNSWLTSFSLTPGNGFFFFPVPGQLDATGEDLVTVFLPYAPTIIGTSIHYQAVLFDPLGQAIGTSPPLEITTLPIL